MEELATKIRRELNTYQAEVAEKLQDLQSHGLISQAEVKKIVIDAKLTAKAVVEGLASQAQYTEEATEIYVYSLFDRYKSKIDKTIRAIEEKQKSSHVLIKGQRVPVYFEDEGGKLIVPSALEKEIANNFLETALETPVSSIKIVVGNMLRDVRISTEKPQGFLGSEVYKLRAETEQQRIQAIYQEFGSAISQLVNSDYPEPVKESSKLKLLEAMQKRLENQSKKVKQKAKNNLFGFFSKFFEEDDGQK